MGGPNTYGARFLASKVQAHAERPSRDVWLTHSTITHELSRPDERLRDLMAPGTHRDVGFWVDRLFFAFKTHFFGKKVRAS